jgi:hypothetical protein
MTLQSRAVRQNPVANRNDAVVWLIEQLEKRE